ncbi:MAG: sigma 54-interacting transcriptional regulator [Planctomycetota bacterium]|nr:sigma 54-interacting transcriptional regulator [Planctomycetota bacterium]
MLAGRALLAQGRVAGAARVLARGADAYRSFRELARRRRAERLPKMLRDYEEHAVRVLRRFSPPIKAGQHPVSRLCRVVGQLPRKRRRYGMRTLRALDAIVTAGQDAPSTEVNGRIAESLARMLGARVLLHYSRGRYHKQEDQRIHTLSTWTLVRLARDRKLVARRVKPAPEFWRPEQRRPSGLLSVPLGRGVACLARSRPFRRREVRAVRSLLRLLAPHRMEAGAPAKRGRGPALPKRARAIKGLVGQSKPWRRVLRDIWRVAPTDCAVLVLGESGTGKEHVARGLHLASPRAHGPFVALNCGAIHQDTLQSELFGHVRGAFTGADRNRPGCFRQAHRGTLFLDEVGDMPPAMQVALLRVLEEKQVLPLGSTEFVKADVRVVCATNKNLEHEVEAGRFREDLLHRLDVVRLALPPLRERPADIPLLAHHLLARTTRAKELHPDALEVLASYGWPGNVRELDNVLQASALLTDAPQVGPEVIEHLLERRRAQALRPERRRSSLSPRATAVLTTMSHEWWSAPRLAQALGVSTRTVNRELTRLMDSGLVEALGQARARRYRTTSDCRDSS